MRAAIVSRQEVVARGLVAMLTDFSERVIVTALPSIRTRAPGVQVIVYDTIGLIEHGDGELQHLLEWTDAAVLILSRDMRPDLRARALALGCHSWISMSIRAKELVEAIELMAAGRSLPEQADALGARAGLSPREVEILALIAQGLPNSDIAARLFMTENTVKSHVRNAYRKIGAASRSQAVAWAMRNGFAPPEA